MPINPEIALQVKPLQLPDPIQSYGNALAMKSHIQQQQLQQQQMQENAFKLKEMQDNKADDDIIKAHYIKNNGDIDATAKSTLGLVGPAKSQHLQQLSLQGQMDRAKMTNEQNTADVASADHQSQIIDAVMKEPDRDKRQALWSNGKALGVAKNWAGMANVPDQAPDNDTLAFTRAVILGGKASGERALQASTLAANEAKLPKEQADSAQAVRSNDSSILGASPTYGDYQDKLAKLSPDRRGVFPDLSTEDRAEPITPEHLTAIRQPGLTGDQQVMTGQRAITEQDRVDSRNENLEFRRDIAASNEALRKAYLGIAQQTADRKGKGNGMTPGQMKVEERNINNTEYGTASRPGQQSQVLTLEQQLRSGKDAKGVELDEDGRKTVESKLEGVRGALQNSQFRKADLYNLGKPDPEDVAALKDGEEIQAQDGSTWKKNHGVAFFMSMGEKGGAAPAPSAPSAPSAPAKTYTEADIRNRMKTRGASAADTDAKVKAARAAGMIQ